MATNYDKYILSAGTHWISNSGKDENSAYHGGKAGDQTGHEWELKGWYSRPWTVVLRYPDLAVALKIAQLGIAAALNDKIGYDQYQRTTYWTQLQAAGYDPSKITVACEEDCTAGVTANVKAVGCLLGIRKLQELPTSVYSGNMRGVFVAAGFQALTGSKYTGQSGYLLPGDILLYEGHHAATNISYGKYVRPSAAPEITPLTPAKPVEGLRKGDKGSAVKAMQKALLAWKPDCLPKYGVDGDFGGETEAAVKAYQKAMGLPVNGVYDAATRKALTGTDEDKPPQTPAPDLRYIRITGGTVNVRSAPGTSGTRVLGVVRKGDSLLYQGESRDVGSTPWYQVEYNKQNAWVSGKYAEVTEG